MKRPLAVVHGRVTHNIPPPPEGCPVTAWIARGRKGEARDAQLTTAEQVAEGVKRRKPTVRVRA